MRNVDWMFTTLLALVFCFSVAKITGIISYSWVYVTAALWAPIVFGTVYVIAIGLLSGLITLSKEIKKDAPK